MDPLAGERTSEAEAEGLDRSDNGAWDPLATVMAGEDASGERGASDDEPWRLDADAEELLAAEGVRERSAAATAPPSTLDRDMEELRFIRLSENATLPSRANTGDAGLDLYAAEAARIGPGERVSVGTGLAVAVPGGLAGLVMPRSGLALRHGVSLVNSPGLIDSGYRGEVRVLLLNTDNDADFRIAKGDRIAQLLLVPIATANPLESDSLDSTGRGSGGFGSSGT